MKRAQWNGMTSIFKLIKPFLRNHLQEHKNITFPISTYEIEFEGQCYLGHMEWKKAGNKLKELKGYLKND
jgi:hypothetical protein